MQGRAQGEQVRGARGLRAGLVRQHRGGKRQGNGRQNHRVQEEPRNHLPAQDESFQRFVNIGVFFYMLVDTLSLCNVVVV